VSAFVSLGLHRGLVEHRIYPLSVLPAGDSDQGRAGGKTATTTAIVEMNRIESNRIERVYQRETIKQNKGELRVISNGVKRSATANPNK